MYQQDSVAAASVVPEPSTEVYFDCPTMRARLSVGACARNREKQFANKQKSVITPSACDKCSEWEAIQEQSNKATKQDMVTQVTGVPTYKRPIRRPNTY